MHEIKLGNSWWAALFHDVDSEKRGLFTMGLSEKRRHFMGSDKGRGGICILQVYVCAYRLRKRYTTNAVDY